MFFSVRVYENDEVRVKKNIIYKKNEPKMPHVSKYIKNENLLHTQHLT